MKPKIVISCFSTDSSNSSNMKLFLFAALIAVAAAGTYKSHPAITIVRSSDVRNGVASSHWK